MATPVAEGPRYSGRRFGGYRRVDRVVTQDLTFAVRVLAALASAVLIVFGLTALARISWDDGVDSAAVEVADVTFTPIVGIAMTTVGVLALLAAAVASRGAKIVVGVLLVCAGIVAFIARPDDGRVVLEDAHAWMTLVVGIVLLLAALAMSWHEARRVVDSDAEYDRVET